MDRYAAQRSSSVADLHNKRRPKRNAFIQMKHADKRETIKPPHSAFTSFMQLN